MVGVGMTPPNVLGAPKPWSSVMISSTLGAPLGGTTRGGHQAFESDAFSLVPPPNVLGAPKPWSSVMISSTLGAPLGGTTRGGHQAFESDAFSLITPPNAGG